MELDLETFLVALYVIVDDFYQSHIQPRLPACGGPPAQMSDSEVLCLGLAAQWRSGVPWKSERGIMRYGRTQLSPGCPPGLTPRAFTRRLRRLWGAFILRQDAVADQLAQGDDDVMDGVPMPVAHGARSFTPGWLADIARIGKGGNDRYFYGVRMMMVINQQGVATGWALASGNVQERWVAELLFSTRAGVPGVQGPLDAQRHKPKVTPPEEWMAADNVQIRPRPFQQPAPPLWIGASVPAAVRRAGRLGDAFVATPSTTLAQTVRLVQTYRQAAVQAGRQPQVVLMRDAWVATSRAEAEAVDRKSTRLNSSHRL